MTFDGLLKIDMGGLRVLCCSLPMLFAVSSALANGHFREREACSRALESGPCQRESDVAGKRPPRYCRGYCIPKDVYYAMLETDPVTHEPGCKCKVRGWLSTRQCRSERLFQAARPGIGLEAQKGRG